MCRNIVYVAVFFLLRGMNIFRLKSRLKYLIKSRYKKGFGVHSPFMYHLMTDVLECKYPYYCFDEIEDIRCQLKPAVRKKCLPRKYGQMLFRLINHFQPECMLEFGMGDGITAQYLQHASGNLAGDYLDQVPNTRCVRNLLSRFLPDLVVFYPDLSADGLRKALLACIEDAGKRGKTDAIYVVCDIHRNPEKLTVWREAVRSANVTSCLDMNKVGIILFRPELEKRCYLYRY